MFKNWKNINITIGRHLLSVHAQYERIWIWANAIHRIWLKSKSVHIDHEQIKNDVQLLNINLNCPYELPQTQILSYVFHTDFYAVLDTHIWLQIAPLI
jgi:hypothetical protein